jgi:hypothetical protein
MPFTPTDISTVKKLRVGDLIFSTYNEGNGGGGGVFQVVKILDRTVRGNSHPSLVTIQRLTDPVYIKDPGHRSFDLDETHLVKVDEISVMERMQILANTIKRLDEVLCESKTKKTEETKAPRKKKAISR